jgi:hypothetical protein
VVLADVHRHPQQPGPEGALLGQAHAGKHPSGRREGAKEGLLDQVRGLLGRARVAPDQRKNQALMSLHQRAERGAVSVEVGPYQSLVARRSRPDQRELRRPLGSFTLGHRQREHMGRTRSRIRRLTP